jgi:hypothetical protein
LLLRAILGRGLVKLSGLYRIQIAIAVIENQNLMHIETALISGLRKQLKRKAGITEHIPNNIETVFFGNVSKYPQGNLTIAHAGDQKEMPEEITKITAYPQDF